MRQEYEDGDGDWDEDEAEDGDNKMCFPDSKIFVAKTFRIKRVNRNNFQIRDKCV